MGVNTMKKRFEIAVAFIMVVVLCLALTGCGQNTSKPATSNNDVTQPDVGGGENHESDTTATQEPTAPSASIDNKNPQQDANGMWVFEVRGHEVKLHTNVWDYIGTDACMADLMRPGMYGAYHELTVSGKENAPKDQVYDVTGSLCENCDKFAVQRELPKIDRGDILIIHDAGAHGRAMGFNYNGKLRCGELLLREDGSVVEIRRRETVEDYFATLDFSGLDSFKA